MNGERQNKRYVFGSVTRTSDLEERSFLVEPLPKEQWETGDFVVGKFAPEVIHTPEAISDTIELTSGRLSHIMTGDLLVGALGTRSATMEAVGDWRLIGSDCRMEDLTGAGIFGVETSRAPNIPHSPPFLYQGHVVREGHKVRMKDFVRQFLLNRKEYKVPTIMLVGTSMSCGKTSAARFIIHTLKSMGFRKVVATKLAGAGYYRDILSMKDAGADAIYDFVDAGLPSSIVPEEDYVDAVRNLLSTIMEESPDVVVAEAGASPFEPYNGYLALREMTAATKMVVLCASDPYAVVGMIHDFGISPDIVTGRVASNSAGVEIVEKISHVPALNLYNNVCVKELEKRLHAALKTAKV